MGLHECEIVHQARTVSTTVPVASCRGFSWDTTSARPVHQTRTVSTYQDSRGTPRVRKTFHQARTVSTYQDSRGTPRVRPNPVVTSTEHFPYNTCPKADQNCAGLMRAERHVTRRDVVSSQTEGNSVSVVEAVHRVDWFSHKIVQVH